MLGFFREKLKSKVIKAGSAYVIGSIALKGIAFLTTPLFTHLMSTSEYGLYGVYLSYEGILSIVIVMGLSNSVRNATIDFKKDLDAYVSSMLGLVTVSFLVIFFIINISYFS